MASTEHSLRNLLAVIHADGGHYESIHGREKAVADARDKVIAAAARIAESDARAKGWSRRVSELVDERNGLQAENARLREALTELLSAAQHSHDMGYITAALCAALGPAQAVLFPKPTTGKEPQ